MKWLVIMKEIKKFSKVARITLSVCLLICCFALAMACNNDKISVPQITLIKESDTVLPCKIDIYDYLASVEDEQYSFDEIALTFDVKKDGQPIELANHTFDAFIAGEYIITICATNPVGGKDTKQVIITVQSVTDKPIIVLNSAVVDDILSVIEREPLDLKQYFEVSDIYSEVEEIIVSFSIKAGNETIENDNGVFTPIVSKEYTVTITAVNKLGLSTNKTLTVRCIDTTAPQIGITQDEVFVYAEQNPSTAIALYDYIESVSDNKTAPENLELSYTVVFEGETITTNQENGSFDLDETGYYTARIIVKDEAQNINYRDIIIVYYPDSEYRLDNSNGFEIEIPTGFPSGTQVLVEMDSQATAYYGALDKSVKSGDWNICGKGSLYGQLDTDRMTHYKFMAVVNHNGGVVLNMDSADHIDYLSIENIEFTELDAFLDNGEKTTQIGGNFVGIGSSVVMSASGISKGTLVEVVFDALYIQDVITAEDRYTTLNTGLQGSILALRNNSNNPGAATNPIALTVDEWDTIRFFTYVDDARISHARETLYSVETLGIPIIFYTGTTSEGDALFIKNFTVNEISDGHLVRGEHGNIATDINTVSIPAGLGINSGDAVSVSMDVKFTKNSTRDFSSNGYSRLLVNNCTSDATANYLIGSGATLTDETNLLDFTGDWVTINFVAYAESGEIVFYTYSGGVEVSKEFVSIGLHILFRNGDNADMIAMRNVSITPATDGPFLPKSLTLNKRQTGEIAVPNADDNEKALSAGDTVTAVFRISCSLTEITGDDSSYLRVIVNGDQTSNYLCGAGATMSGYNRAADMLGVLEITVDLVIQAQGSTITLRTNYNQTMTENGFAFLIWGVATPPATVTIELLSVTLVEPPLDTLTLSKRATGEITVPNVDKNGETLSAGDTVAAKFRIYPMDTLNTNDDYLRVIVNGDQASSYLCGVGATLSEYDTAADMSGILEITVDLVIQASGETVLLRSQGELRWEQIMSENGFAFLFWGSANSDKITIELLSVTLKAD